MSLLEMIFSLGLLLIILGSWIVWKKTRPKYIVSFLETGTPTFKSYRKSEKSRKRYFSCEEGIIDLEKHPELIRFRDIFGEKEYLVEPWMRDKRLYVEEGKTKIVFFEVVKKDDVSIAIPCLRTIETIIKNETDNPLHQYQETYFGVDCEGIKKTVKLDNIIGVVKYESLQD